MLNKKVIGAGGHIAQFLTLDEIEKRKTHRRFKVFYHYGTKCYYYDRIGTMVVERYEINKAGQIKSKHVDLITKDYELMTIDHVFPKSMGGSSDLDNLVPSCFECNAKKSNEGRVTNRKEFLMFVRHLAEKSNISVEKIISNMRFLNYV